MKIAMDDFEAAAKRQTHLIIDSVLEQLQTKVNEKLIERLKAPSDTMTMESNATLRKAAANYDGMLGEISSIARSSGITTLRHEVAANAAHVSSGNTEFRASAVKVSGRSCC